MNRQPEKLRPPLTGGSSLLVIFAVLCLTVFALVGLSMVQADRRLADAGIRAVREYYAADCAAESILAQLRMGVIAEGVDVRDGIYSYSCPISDTQVLLVQARIDGPDDWQILRWQAVSPAQWGEEQHLNVWNGETNVGEQANDA